VATATLSKNRHVQKGAVRNNHSAKLNKLQLTISSVWRISAES